MVSSRLRRTSTATIAGTVVGQDGRSPIPGAQISLDEEGDARFGSEDSARPDGSPHSVATWYLWDGARILLNMDGSRARLAFLRRDPRVSLTVLDAESWYREVSLDGRVAELVDDTVLEDIDRLARHYTGQPFRNRERRRFSAVVKPSAWHAWDSWPRAPTHS